MLIDTTLREGGQLFGAYFNMDFSRELLLDLEAAGVDEAEAGWAGMPGLAELVAWANTTLSRMRLTVWSPAREQDIDMLAQMGVKRIHIAIPVSDAHRQKRLRLGRAELIQRTAAVVAHARTHGFESIGLGLEDASRAETSFVLQVARAAARNGASRLRLADTVGAWSPVETMEAVRYYMDNLPLPVGVHCHNDFGMGTANAIAALRAGAFSADVSILGIGERSGIAALEEVAGYLALRQKTAAYDMGRIAALCRRVSEQAQVHISRTKPVVGEDIFACESGLHLHALALDPTLYEPYEPESVQARRKTAVGKKSGRAAVRAAAAAAGIDLSDSCLGSLAGAIRNLSAKLDRPLNSAEFRDLALRQCN